MPYSVSGNGVLDLTVADIDSRFNHATNSGVTDEQRWGLANVLSVEENSYDLLELALLDITVTQTLTILDSAFTSAWSASDPITPTLMFAWEHNYRTVGLSSENLSWSNAVLTVEVATSGANPVQIIQENGMNWAPDGYNRATAGLPPTSTTTGVVWTINCQGLSAATTILLQTLRSPSIFT